MRADCESKRKSAETSGYDFARQLSHSAGLLDVLIGQTAVALGAPLQTFNQRHYGFIPGVQTVEPYSKSG